MSEHGFKRTRDNMRRQSGAGLRRRVTLLAGLAVGVVAVGFGLQKLASDWWQSGGSRERPIQVMTVAGPPPMAEPAPAPRQRLPVIPRQAEPRPEPEPAPAPQPRTRREAAQAEPQREYVTLGGGFTSVQAQPAEMPWFHDGRRPTMATGCAVRRGTQIPAILVTAIQSRVGGEVIARVRDDVKSDDVGYQNKTLIPQGTTVVGKVQRDGGLQFDEDRVVVVWEEMRHPYGFGENPNVTQVDLAQASAASADGSGGIGGTVRHQWGTLAAYAALTTVFNVAARPRRDSGPWVDEAGRTIGNLGNEVLRRSLDWEPRVEVPPGAEINVLLQRTVQVC